MVLNDKMADPNNRSPIQPIIAQVLDHQRLIQALLSDSLALFFTNTMLAQQELANSARFRRKLHGI